MMAELAGKTRWIAVDWGTSNLRVSAMGDDYRVLATRTSDQGMGRLKPQEYEAALLALADEFLENGTVTPVLCAGMVGAKQGWLEAPYRRTPCGVTDVADAVRVKTADPRLDVHILAGVSQAKPADVMRGEETQIAGFLRDNADFDGVICLPGTHSKWVHISAEEIVSFQTFMTGEMFALLAEQSVLRHSVAKDGWDKDAFVAALEDGLSHPQRVAAQLFSLRAASLLENQSGGVAAGRLSGLLIGMELAAARPYWLGQKVVLIGAEAVADAYQIALGHVGVYAEIQAADDLSRTGLSAAYDALIGDRT